MPLWDKTNNKTNRKKRDDTKLLNFRRARGKHQSRFPPQRRCLWGRITATKRLFRREQMSQSLVFPELVYPEIFVSKTENLKKRQQQQKPKKEGGAREVKLGSPLQNTQIKKKNKSFANKTTKHRWGAASTERTWLPVVMLETEAQQQDTSCCSHSFASFRGFREYPSVEDGKGKIKTPIRVAVAERRRRETVKRTPCVGALPLASCCLREPTELWETERLWSPGK